MPTIRKIRDHAGDTYPRGAWLRCNTVRATELLATGAWVDADAGALADAPEVEEKRIAPKRNKMLEPTEDK